LDGLDCDLFSAFLNFSLNSPRSFLALHEFLPASERRLIPRLSLKHSHSPDRWPYSPSRSDFCFGDTFPCRCPQKNRLALQRLRESSRTSPPLTFVISGERHRTMPYNSSREVVTLAPFPARPSVLLRVGVFFLGPVCAAARCVFFVILWSGFQTRRDCSSGVACSRAIASRFL